MLLGGAFGVLLYYAIDWLVAWPEPLPLIARLAEEDPLVQAELTGGAEGRLHCSPFWTGNVRADSSASVAIPISGAKGSGVLYARALYHPPSRQWRLLYLQAALHGQSQKHSLCIPPQHQMPPTYSPPSNRPDPASLPFTTAPPHSDPTLQATANQPSR